MPSPDLYTVLASANRTLNTQADERENVFPTIAYLDWIDGRPAAAEPRTATP